MTLEQAIATIQVDELAEVTPRGVRIRKRSVDPGERERQSPKAEAADRACQRAREVRRTYHSGYSTIAA
jgi:hypothetical protein